MTGQTISKAKDRIKLIPWAPNLLLFPLMRALWGQFNPDLGYPGWVLMFAPNAKIVNIIYWRKYARRFNPYLQILENSSRNRGVSQSVFWKTHPIFSKKLNFGVWVRVFLGKLIHRNFMDTYSVMDQNRGVNGSVLWKTHPSRFHTWILPILPSYESTLEASGMLVTLFWWHFRDDGDISYSSVHLFSLIPSPYHITNLDYH